MLSLEVGDRLSGVKSARSRGLGSYMDVPPGLSLEHRLIYLVGWKGFIRCDSGMCVGVGKMGPIRGLEIGFSGQSRLGHRMWSRDFISPFGEGVWRRRSDIFTKLYLGVGFG